MAQIEAAELASKRYTLNDPVEAREFFHSERAGKAAGRGDGGHSAAGMILA